MRSGIQKCRKRDEQAKIGEGLRTPAARPRILASKRARHLGLDLLGCGTNEPIAFCLARPRNG